MYNRRGKCVEGGRRHNCGVASGEFESQGLALSYVTSNCTEAMLQIGHREKPSSSSSGDVARTYRSFGSSQPEKCAQGLTLWTR